MSELVKTVIFLAVSFVVLGTALAVRYWPSAEPAGPETATLFKDFKDPLEARSLEISRYDEVTNEVNRFSVDQVGGRWVIPSHDGYPADAEEQMKQAATSLIGLEVLGVKSNMQGDHELYGVVEPDAEKLKPGAKGVGVMITMKDAKGDQLAGLIIGKAEKDNDRYRFVRIPGQSQVYVVEIDLSKLSTKFEDWIEKDLLQLNPLDIEQITFDDYSIETRLDARSGEARSSQNRRMRMTVHDVSGKWQLDELLRFIGGQETKVSLATSEELNSAKLGELRTALDELKIVDVRRKPEGLGADLKGDTGIRLNEENIASLFDRGFIPAFSSEGPNPTIEVLSRNGDLIVETKQGVQYLLRFGNLAPSQDPAQVDQLNRYLMVACSVAEEKFPEPKPPLLPELPAGPEPPPKPAAPAEKDAAEKDAAEKDAGEKDAAAAGAAKGAEAKDAKDGGDTPSADAVEESQDSDQKKENAEDSNEDAAKADGSTDDEQAEDENQAEDEKQPAEPELDRAKILAERDRLTTAYERERDKWREDRQQAAEKVRALNARFADWYYVIPEDVYKKIHLGRAELIKEKENIAEEGYEIDAFRHLEQEGLHVEQPDDGHDHPPLNFPNS